MSVIHFKSEKALNYLLEHGEVYTLRVKRRKTGLAWVKHKGRKIADAVVEYVAEITNFDELEKYVDKSGFNSVEEWLNEVKKLNKGKLPNKLYLYRVSVDKLDVFGGKLEELSKKIRMEILSNLVLMPFSLKCLQSDKHRYFLVVFYPTNTLPAILVFHDNKCMICGEELTDSEKPAKCMLCGNVDESPSVICERGHYVCPTCYHNELLKHLDPYVHQMLANIDYVNDLAKHIAKKYDRPKGVAYRGALASLFRKSKLEVTMLTNAMWINWTPYLKACSRCKDGECPMKNILEGL